VRHKTLDVRHENIKCTCENIKDRKQKNQNKEGIMKNLRIVIAAILLFALLAGIGSANIPAPPVNQQVALYDTNMVNVSVDHSLPGSTPYACKDCHLNPRDTHHDMVTAGATILGCVDCHPLSGVPLRMTISRNCHDCHDGTGFPANPAVNLSVLRGKPGRPHHNILKNNSAILNPTFQAAYWAADKKCVNCHGSTIVANYNDAHYIPDYSASSVTPFADFKINTTQSGDGRKYGGCQACHEPDATASPLINDNEVTHHTVRFWVGYQCNDCHVALGKYTPRTPGGGIFNDTTGEPINDYNPAPNAKYLSIWFNSTYPAYVSAYGWDVSQKHMELRNSTMQAAGDTLNGTGCQKCHDVITLHNIEGSAPGMNSTETRLANIPGYGHIGNNSDCNGCHQGWATPATDLNPFPGPGSITIASVTPGLITAGVATDVTLTGSGFEQATYTTKVLVDGAEVTQVGTLTDSQIVVTVPALAAGVHAIQVEKGGSTSGLRELAAQGTVTITGAELASGVLTITGAGFGSVDMTSVVVDKADGSQEVAATTSWADGQIVANSAAAVGDSVTVITGDGAATATIAGVAPTPTPTPIPVDSVTVTAPNGGESFKRGTTITVTWDRAGASQATNVKIELLKGTSVVAKISSTPNDGTQTLKLPTSTGTNYKVRITSLSHTPSYTDSSDNFFSLTR